MNVRRWIHVAAAALVAATIAAPTLSGRVARADEPAALRASVRQTPAPSSRRKKPTAPATDKRANPLRATQPQPLPQTRFSRAQSRPAGATANRQASAHVVAGEHRVARALQEDELDVPAVPSDEQPEVVAPPPGSASPEGIVEGYPGGSYEGGYGDYGGCDTCGTSDDCFADCCELCGPPGRFWVNADYLLWWTKDSRYPALITASPISVPPDEAGVLGLPTTDIVFGDTRDGQDSFSGARIRGGMWLDCCHCWGVEGDYFAIDDDTFNRTFYCDETTALARPFFNVQTGVQDSELVCYEGIVDGTATINATSSFQGAGGRLRMNAFCDSFCEPCCALQMGPGLPSHCGDPCWMTQSYNRVDVLAGYRFYRLDDSLLITEDLVSTNTGGVIPLGTTFALLDDFRSRNEFHGAELGLHLDTRRGRWGLDFMGLVALGNNHQEADVSGFTLATVPDEVPIATQAGLLAQATNSGHFENDDFIVIPQFNLNASYYLTQNLKIHAGYTVIYWGRVARAAELIDPRINPTQIPPGTLSGAPLPAFDFNDTSYWAHGLNFGGELRF